MGGWFSFMWWGGDPDAPSPVSGLTRREIYAVQKSWAPVYANSVATGTELLRRILVPNYITIDHTYCTLAYHFYPFRIRYYNKLFRTYPETREFFKMVRKLPEEEYEQNPQFKAHVINLMSSLNMAINALHQPEVVIAIMNKLGESHGKRLIKEQNFHDLKSVIVQMFIEVLNLDAATLGAWGKTVDFWYTNIFQTLNSNQEAR